MHHPGVGQHTLAIANRRSPRPTRTGTLSPETKARQDARARRLASIFRAERAMRDPSRWLPPCPEAVATRRSRLEHVRLYSRS